MAKIISEVKIEAVTGQQVELPRGDFVANADFHREGTDLYLTSPDGHTIMVEGYFNQIPAPDLVTKDGARLSSEMVDAFLPPEHAGQYAASGQMANDASPAGKITEVVGEAHIIRADGTHVTAAVGTPVYPGDVVQTSPKGAVNLLFADNTTFAISESARLSVDQFTYNAHEQSGSSFFSMLQGVFVYTSGLIGKHDPGSVNIETPVGSIGIRGTVVAGHIAAAGHDSQITIVDGAIVLTNAAGTLEMNHSFGTASMSSYQQAPTSTGQMSVAAFTQSYHSVAAVAGDTFNHLDSFHNNANAPGGTGEAPAPDHANTNTPDHGTAPSAPDAAHPAGPQGNAAPGTAPHDAAATPQPQMMMDPAATAGVPPPPPSSSGFGAMMTAAPNAGMTAPPPGTTGGSNFGGAPAGGFSTPPPPNGGTGAQAGNSGGSSQSSPNQSPNNGGTPAGTGDGGAPHNPQVGFAFSTGYLNGTPGNIADDGLPLFLAGAGAGPFLIGHIQTNFLPDGAQVQLVGNFGAQSLHLTTAGTYTTTTTTTTNNAAYSVDANGNLFLNDPGAALSSINPVHGFDIVVTASSGAPLFATPYHFDVIYREPNIAMPGANIRIGDGSPGNTLDISPTTATSHIDSFVGTTGDDFFIGRGGDDSLTGNGGQDTLLGGEGNDMLRVLAQGFHFVDGGAGNDTLVLGNATSAFSNFDFTGMAPDLAHLTGAIGLVRNIETITLGTGPSQANNIKLNILDVFDMTDSNHRLEIGTVGNTLTTAQVMIAAVPNAPAGSGFHLDNGTIGGGGDVTLAGFYNNQTVTLIIHQDSVGGHINIVTV